VHLSRVAAFDVRVSPRALEGRGSVQSDDVGVELKGVRWMESKGVEVCRD
jgi:hypothetical protein